MILFTDGQNNAGVIDPLTASRLAQDLGIRIYTIGVGSDVEIYISSYGRRTYRSDLDETLLMQIADITGGQYFRAKDPGALPQIFATIDQLEKTEFQDNDFKVYSELAFTLIKVALLLLLAGIVLDKYCFVQIP